MNLQTIKLSDGNELPPLGLGLWKIRGAEQFSQTFQAAVAAGYRHFDSAQAYGNEQLLGTAWRETGLRRGDIFITTKILVQNFGYKKVISSFEASLQKLQTDHVDLLLLHFPGLPWLRKSSWQALEDIQSANKATSIGVSNYGVKHLKAMERYAHRMPAVNQVEMHVFLQQREVRVYCEAQHIQLEAYSPLAHGRAMDEPVIQRIAQKHHKSYAQIMLRWCVQMGAVPLPKSTTPARLRENIDIFDFALDREDMHELQTLDRNLRTVWRSIVFG